MSKIKKKRIDSLSEISEKDIKFQKIIQFSGWLFIILLIGFMGAWILFDYFLSIIDLELTPSTFTFIIFSGTNSAISFGLASKIKNDKENKVKIFRDWLWGELLFCFFAIAAVGAYQW
ncbi:MAG: hypothetical protein ACFFCE_12600 [Promethearchaeota archaeon]